MQNFETLFDANFNISSIHTNMNITTFDTNSSWLNLTALSSVSDHQHDMASILAAFHASLFTHREPRTIFLITVYIPLFLLALAGNTLVILVILTSKRTRSLSNYFVLNLSIADLLVTIVCMPLTIGEMVYKVWIYGNIMCKAVGYLQGVSIAASVLTIMALSFERFLVIRYPVLSRRLRKHHILLTIVLIWLISGIVMLPMLVVRGITLHPLSTDTHTLNICHEKWSSMQKRQALDLFLFVFIYVIPGAVVVVLHSASGCHLLMGSEELQRQGSVSHSQKVVAGRRRVARMLLSLAILFAVSWMPYHIVTLYTDFQPRSAPDKVTLVMSFSLLLGHSNSAQNPVIYCLMNNFVRKGAKKLLTCKKNICESASVSSYRHSILIRSTVTAAALESHSIPPTT